MTKKSLSPCLTTGDFILDREEGTEKRAQNSMCDFKCLCSASEYIGRPEGVLRAKGIVKQCRALVGCIVRLSHDRRRRKEIWE